MKTTAAAATVIMIGACAAPPPPQHGESRAAGSPSVAAEPPAVTVEQAARTIRAREVLGHIAFLASDAMRGRDTPSPGLDSAAAYLAGRFRALGLEPGAEDGRSFIQRYRLPLIALAAERTTLGLRTPDGEHEFSYGDEFFATPGSPGSVEGRLVLMAGTPMERWDDVAAVEGAIPVVVLDGSFSRAWRKTIAPARAAARRAGAGAILFVLNRSISAGTVEQLAAFVAGPRRVLGGVQRIPAFFLRREPFVRAFDAAGVELDPDELGSGEGDADHPAAGPSPEDGVANINGVRIFDDVTAETAAPVNMLEAASAPNVVAILPGSDPELRDRYVVLSAHVDHVGVGLADSTGDSIYNGADDNASGTSALIEIAEAFTKLERRPARSVIFLGVSGEEKELLGSRWFTSHPTVPLRSIVANINMDMIGRNSPDSIVAVGMKYTSLGRLARRVADEHPSLELTVSEDIWPQQRFFFRSDHFNFARHEIPAIFFFAGVHEDYHQPSDEVSEIREDKAARVARLIFYVAHAVATSERPPRWTPEGLAEIRRMTG